MRKILGREKNPDLQEFTLEVPCSPRQQKGRHGPADRGEVRVRPCWRKQLSQLPPYLNSIIIIIIISTNPYHHYFLQELLIVSIRAAAEIAKDTTGQRCHVFNNIDIRKDSITFHINMDFETAWGLLIASKILH